MSNVRSILRGKTSSIGKVWLVGAGPGDPELLTVRAHRLLSECKVLAYDELVSAEILVIAPASAERIPVGRRANGCRHHDEKIHRLVVDRALAGHDVVRLKGGDPMVFGRGGEEAEELAKHGIPFSIVPGISAALGAAASTGIPLTHREAASSVTFATAHASKGDGDPKLAVTLPITGTVVLYMGLGRLAETTSSLIAAGRAPTMPAAIVASATRPEQRVVIATLETLVDAAKQADLQPPALMIIGDVVARAVQSPRAEEELVAFVAAG
jgi:uroporphyrin-III C-methyltransferase